MGSYMMQTGSHRKKTGVDGVPGSESGQHTQAGEEIEHWKRD
jgi:hypothetical protein